MDILRHKGLSMATYTCLEYLIIFSYTSLILNFLRFLVMVTCIALKSLFKSTRRFFKWFFNSAWELLVREVLLIL